MTGSILVVDDDRVNRMLLAKALELEGHDVRLAEDGTVGLELLAAERADVVLLDVVMPGLDGMTVLQRMREDDALRDVPVIMVSALDDFDSVIRCIELGAEDYLSKPFDPVLLRARVNAALNKARLQDVERARVRDVFTRFLPEPIVDEVMTTNGGALSLVGVRRVGSVLFSDIRGFTTFAEAKSPGVVVDVLNRYLTEMSDASPRQRRDARGVQRRRHHGGVRRADRVRGSCRSSCCGRAGHGHEAIAPVQRLAPGRRSRRRFPNRRRGGEWPFHVGQHRLRAPAGVLGDR